MIEELLERQQDSITYLAERCQHLTDLLLTTQPPVTSLRQQRRMSVDSSINDFSASAISSAALMTDWFNTCIKQLQVTSYWASVVPVVYSSLVYVCLTAALPGNDFSASAASWAALISDCPILHAVTNNCKWHLYHSLLICNYCTLMILPFLSESSVAIGEVHNVLIWKTDSSTNDLCVATVNLELTLNFWAEN